MAFFNRFLRSLVILAILAFCAGGIILSFLKRDFTRSEYGGLVVGLTFFEDRFQDWKVRSRMTSEIDHDIVLVNIDDESLSKIGTWPIPRTVHAQMLRQLKSFGTKVVALDILFPEKAPVCGPVDPDKELAQAFSEFVEGGESTAILTYELDDDDGQKRPIPDDLLFFVMNSQNQGGGAMELHSLSQENYPTKDLIVPDLQLGHIANNEDPDGVFRNYKIIANVRDGEDSAYFPSLGLMAYEAYSGTHAQLKIRADGWGELELGKTKVEVSPFGETKLRYFGDRQNFPSVSLHKVISAKPDDPTMRKIFGGKIAFVGSSATGAHDLRNTPVDSRLPGVYAHMNAVHMLMHGRLFKPEEESIRWSLILLALTASILMLIMYFDRAILDVLVITSLAVGVYWVDAIYFFPHGHEIRLFYILLCLFLIYSWNTFLNFNAASKEKKQIKGTFARYVSPAIVSEMLSNPEKLKVGGEKKDITCLFSDVRDFTTISEKLSAADLSYCMNRYLGTMTDLVFATKGTLDKYIGDAIVAFWGAPLDLEGNPDYAVTGAVQMMEALPVVNAEFRAKGFPEFKIGIGLNSGECSVGNMGSNMIFSYTALGDNMNLGARLESLTKHYGVHILISEFTFARLPEGKYTTRPIDKVKVKGKTKPVVIHEVLYQGHPFMQDTTARVDYIKGHAYYVAQEFALAQALLQKVLERHPEDKSTLRFLKYCEKWLEASEIPEDFEVTTMTEKS